MIPSYDLDRLDQLSISEAKELISRKELPRHSVSSRDHRLQAGGALIHV